jgi:2-dehydropantoate 2-reductase
VTGGDGTAAAELPVVCAQNGVANEAMALRRFRQVYGMCVWLPATHVAPGEVAAHGQPKAGMLVVGRYPAGTDATIEQVAADLAGSRFLAPVSADVMRWKYRKLLGNLGNALEALCGRDQAGQGGAAAAAMGRLRELIAAEGTAVLDAAGIGYVTDGELGAARGQQVEVGQVPGSPHGGGSSWQSLARGTGSIEADFLNGEIVLLGREHGVQAPVNEALQRLANRAAAGRVPPGSTTPAQILAAAGYPAPADETATAG